MKKELTQAELSSVKRSYLNILALFLGKPKVESKYVACLLKWAVQLDFGPEDLREVEEHFNQMKFQMPEDTNHKIDSIFDLVQMIYLDNIVEDIELEVASIYAEQLGFKKYIVGEMFQSIATAPYDGKSIDSVKKEIRSLIDAYRD